MQGHFGTPRSGATLHVHDMTLYCMNRSFLANSCTQCAGSFLANSCTQCAGSFLATHVLSALDHF